MQFADYAALEVCAIPPFRLNRGARRPGTYLQAAQPYASMRPQPKQPSKTMQPLITATHSRPVQYSQDHAYRQEAPTRLPHSFLAEGPRASRALSASRASSSLSSTGSNPAWPSPCRGRPSGRRGRTRRATMRACGLRPARRWASSACSCAGATWPLCRGAWWPGRCSLSAPCGRRSRGGSATSERAKDGSASQPRSTRSIGRSWAGRCPDA